MKALLSAALLLFASVIVRAQNGSVGIGTTTPQAQLHTTASVRHDTLAGLGQRPVYADATGKLFTPQATFLSNNTSVAIPDNGCGAVPNGAVSTITFSGWPFNATSSKIKVRVSLQHPNMSEVTLYLQSPGGQVLRLMSGASGYGLNNAVFSDGALGQVPYGPAMHSGHYLPKGFTSGACGITPNITTFSAFGSYNLIDPSGTWTLRAYDNAQYSVGSLQSWSISFDGSDPLPSQVISSGVIPRGTSGGGLTNGTLYDIGGAVGVGMQAPHAPLQFANASAYRKMVLYEQGNNDHQFTGFGTGSGSLYCQLPNEYSDYILYRGINSGTSLELFRVTGTGNVGIGTWAPNAPLQFSNTASLRKIVLQESVNNDHQFVGFGISGGDDLRYQTSSASGDHVFNSGAGATSSELMRITGDGLVGIGTSSPGTKAKVEIWGGAWATPSHYRYMNPSTDGNISNNTTANHYSLFTNDRIWCGGEINVTSDARTKESIASSLPASDLALVNRLRVVDYNYVDRVTKGDTRVKGFLAQEVEAVMPDAVIRNTGVVPNIYRKAESVQHNASLSTLTVVLKSAHGLAVGDTVKLITDADGDKLVPVVAVQDPNSFTVGEWTTATEWAFVYGKQVQDLRNLDYNKIFSAGISAIQELSREVTALEKRMNAAEASAADAKREMAELRASVERLTGTLQTARR